MLASVQEIICILPACSSPMSVNFKAVTWTWQRILQQSYFLQHWARNYISPTLVQSFAKKEEKKKEEKRNRRKKVNESKTPNNRIQKKEKKVYEEAEENTERVN